MNRPFSAAGRLSWSSRQVPWRMAKEPSILLVCSHNLRAPPEVPPALVSVERPSCLRGVENDGCNGHLLGSVLDLPCVVCGARSQGAFLSPMEPQLLPILTCGNCTVPHEVNEFLAGWLPDRPCSAADLRYND